MVPRIHVRWHTTIYNSGSKGIQSQWPEIFLLICSCPHERQREIETERNKILKKKFIGFWKLVCAPNLVLISYFCVCVACGEYICVHVLIEDRGWYWEFPLISLPLIHWGRVSQFKAALDDRASSLRSSPLSEPPIHWAQRWAPHLLDFCKNSGDLNFCFHTCVASSLSTEPSSQPGCLNTWGF